MSKQEGKSDNPSSIMDKIQAMIAPPTSEEKGSKKKEGLDLHPYYKRPGKGHNHDSCDSCNEGGNLICCDRCPASFHLVCQNPPLDDCDIPIGQWICQRCRVKENGISDDEELEERSKSKRFKEWERKNEEIILEESQPSTSSGITHERRAKGEAKDKMMMCQPRKPISNKSKRPSTHKIEEASDPSEFSSTKEDSSTLNMDESLIKDEELDEKSKSERKKEEEILLEQSQPSTSSGITHERRAKGEAIKKMSIDQPRKPIINKSKRPSTNKMEESSSSSDGFCTKNMEDLFTKMTRAVRSMNPLTFTLPLELQVKKMLPGDDKVPERRKSKKKPHEIDSQGQVPLPAKLCFRCNKSCREAFLMGCDYCDLLFHLDCLDPPLTAPPNCLWICPNHPQNHVDEVLWKTGRYTERIALWDKYALVPVNELKVKTDFIRTAHRRSYHPFRTKNPPRHTVQVPEKVKYHYDNPLPNELSMKSLIRACAFMDREMLTEQLLEREELRLKATAQEQELVVSAFLQMQVEGVLKLQQLRKESQQMLHNSNENFDCEQVPCSNNVNINGTESQETKKDTIDEKMDIKSEYMEKDSIVNHDIIPNNKIFENQIDHEKVCEEQKDNHSIKENLGKEDVVINNINGETNNEDLVVSNTKNKVLHSLKSETCGITELADVACFALEDLTNGDVKNDIEIESEPILEWNNSVVLDDLPSSSLEKSETLMDIPRGGIQIEENGVNKVKHNDKFHNKNPKRIKLDSTVKDMFTNLPEVIDDLNDEILNNFDPTVVRLLALQQLRALRENCRDASSSSTASTLIGQDRVIRKPKRRKRKLENSCLVVECGTSTRGALLPRMPVVSPELKNQPILLKDTNFIIGLDGTSDLVLSKYGKCNMVSNMHAVISYNKKSSSYTLINFSEFGTAVNCVLYGLDGSRQTYNSQPSLLQKEINKISKIKKKRKKLVGPALPKDENLDPPVEVNTTTIRPNEKVKCSCKSPQTKYITKLESSAKLTHGCLISFGCLTFSLSHFISMPDNHSQPSPVLSYQPNTPNTPPSQPKTL